MYRLPRPSTSIQVILLASTAFALAVFLLLSPPAWLTARFGPATAEQTGTLPPGAGHEPAFVAELEAPSYKIPRIERQAARADYFYRMLRDPATDRIPAYVRQRELRVAARLPRRLSGLSKAATMTWEEAGPDDVGGRTRALGVDVRNSDVVLAGGTSGGIWKSTDGGESWTLKSDPSDPLSVTWLTQDPNTPDTWYYSTGEYNGSAGDHSGNARFHGSGLYKSTDNGESWDRIQEAGSATQNDSPFDFVSRIEVSAATGSVFIASNTIGIHRSTDGGASFELVLGGSDAHRYSDLVVGPDGRLTAVLSGGQGSSPDQDPGVYVSTDDGETWAPLVVDGFSSAPTRSVLSLAPSNPDVVYLVSDTEPPSFYRLDTASMTAEDRSESLPDFDEPVGGLDFQGGYNMVVAVHPEDEDHVLIGATNLFRSRDGFATPADDVTDVWIGGYSNENNVDLYPNQHPDQHVLVFDPVDPNRLWAGHDGGLSVLPDVTESLETMPWESKNNGYNVTQYYTVALRHFVGDDRIVGGTQDNGSPFFTYDGAASPSFDASTGDGAFAYLGESYAYVSAQQGTVLRRAYDDGGAPRATNDRIDPEGAEEALFINPFAVDPNDEDVMYFPAVDEIWRTTELSTIEDGAGWERMEGLEVPDGFTVSAASFSQSPAHVFYAGLSSSSERPHLLRLGDAHEATDGEELIVMDGAPAGTYVHDVAVNPNDADEILVVLSNYNVIGLFHSADGGATFEAVEGNLHADGQGPSLRGAGFLPLGGGMLYLVATSTGVYTTAGLNGMDTVWEQEGALELGNVVAADLDVRSADGVVAVGTHGRGIFLGQAPIGNVAPSARFTAARSLNDPLEVTFDASSSADPNGDEISYTWDFGDGAVGTGAVITHVYDEEGTYEVRLEVRDPEGLTGTDDQSIEVGGVIVRTVRSFDPTELLVVAGLDAIEPIDTGFVFGPNVTSQRQFASAMMLPDGAEEAVLTEVRVLWAYKRPDVGERTYTLNIYDGDAETGPTGDPIFSSEYAMADVVADEDWTDPVGTTSYAIDADEPVAVGESFFVSLDFGEYGPEDWGAVGLVQQSVDEVTPETWVQWPDGAWSGYAEVMPDFGDRLIIQADLEFGRRIANTGAERRAELPDGFALDQNYPNPFNPQTTIRFALPEPSPVRLTVYDTAGRQVALLVDRAYAAGDHDVTWDAAGFPSGVYHYRLEAENYLETRSMVLVR